MNKPHLIGINHIALEVGDIEKALSFYEAIFKFTLRHKDASHAFIELGDQFIALMRNDKKHQDNIRHFGLVVDNSNAVKELAKEAGATLLDGPFLDFLDPWGNRIQVVEYADIQFIKSPEVLASMRISVAKGKKAREELKAKGINKIF